MREEAVGQGGAGLRRVEGGVREYQKTGEDNIRKRQRGK